MGIPTQRDRKQPNYAENSKPSTYFQQPTIRISQTTSTQQRSIPSSTTPPNLLNMTLNSTTIPTYNMPNLLGNPPLGMTMLMQQMTPPGAAAQKHQQQNNTTPNSNNTAASFGWGNGPSNVN